MELFSFSLVSIVVFSRTSVTSMHEFHVPLSPCPPVSVFVCSMLSTFCESTIIADARGHYMRTQAATLEQDINETDPPSTTLRHFLSLHQRAPIQLYLLLSLRLTCIPCSLQSKLILLDFFLKYSVCPDVIDVY